MENIIRRAERLVEDWDKLIEKCDIVIKKNKEGEEWKNENG